MGRKRIKNKPSDSLGKQAPAGETFPKESEADEILDLHNLTLDEAEAAVELLLERHPPKARLLIIHGHSHAGPGSIRARITRNLEGKWKSRVHRFRRDFLNPGATWVETA